MTAAEGFAPAKINLTLHVTGQRGDGYHLMDSLLVFANIGDRIAVSSGAGLSLAIEGPMAAGLDAGQDNLVLRAARAFGGERGAALVLTKHLPVASGIGGGSADAAATLRVLSAFWERPLPSERDVLALGADVPVCLRGKPTRLQGIGETLLDVPDLPDMDILLVNPGIAVPTPAVFRALETKTNPPMAAVPSRLAAGPFCDWLADQRNDLLKPALSVAPGIQGVLDQIRGTDCLFTGMSGSGATCFGLYPPDGYSARSARAHLRAHRPEWWAEACQVMRSTT